MQRHGTIFGGSLLVAATTIGGGMLALPVLTSPGGFAPSIVIYVLCWLFMSLTGMLFMELALHMEDGVNIVTMAKRTLGPLGKIAAWALYLFLFYCLTVAYIVGCGDILTTFFANYLPRSSGPAVFLLIFAPFVYIGTHLIGKLNYFLMAALALLYFSFVIIGAADVKIQNLIPHNFALSLLALPIAFTAFAYQGIVPTLVSYLDRDPRKVTASIWIGTFISLVTYCIWQWLILGIIPFEGAGGLKEALAEGRNAVYPLKNTYDNPIIFKIGQGFAFLALLTSFFGVTLGLKDFLADALKIKQTPKGKLLICALIFIPPLLIAHVYPDIFLQALDYAGGYGCALLLGLLPILMVARLRYQHPEYKPYVAGGMWLLGALMAFVLFELAIEIIY